MVDQETLTSVEAITLNVRVTKQLERQVKTMMFNYLVEVEYRDGSVRAKLFNYKEADKANRYHSRMENSWGKSIKKVTTKRI